MNDSRHFSAPWSPTLKVISAVVVLLLGGAAVTSMMTPGVGPAGRVVGLVLAPAGILIAGLYSVRGYTLGAGELRVKRLLWETRIPLAGLQSATADPRAIGSSVRIWGNGGFFSFSGWFWNRALGRYRMLVTDPRLSVVLRFADRRPLVVSPAGPADFVRAALACSGRLPG